MATKKKDYLYAVGRRKTASARVRFYETGERVGEVEVNGKDRTEYFSPLNADIVIQPLGLLDTPANGYFTVKVEGGGKHAQAEAVRHGIARILVEMNPDARAILKSRGYLTRDPRMKERKKPGLRRARRAPQWSKR